MGTINRKAKIADNISTVILYITAVFFLLLLAAFTIYILYKGAAALFTTTSISGGKSLVKFALHLDYLGFTKEGIGLQFFNTIYIVFLSLILSCPIGIAAGIYMAEYAMPGRLTDFIRTCIETLSSLPSIVVGLFGYLALVVMTHSHLNLLAGSVAISILSLPLLARVTEDAIRAIPDIYREGSYGVGATHWQTIARVLLPTSLPRIITGIILAAGRGFGEAAALIYTAGMGSDIVMGNFNPSSPTSILNPFRSADTLAVHIWALKSESILPNANEIANLSAAVLIILVFVFSIGSRKIGSLIERKMLGKDSGGLK
jgi:phosphate transport system permease protein